MIEAMGTEKGKLHKYDSNSVEQELDFEETSSEKEHDMSGFVTLGRDNPEGGVPAKMILPTEDAPLAGSVPGRRPQTSVSDYQIPGYIPPADDYPQGGVAQPEADILPAEYASSASHHFDTSVRNRVANISTSSIRALADAYPEGGVGQPEADVLPAEYGSQAENHPGKVVRKPIVDKLIPGNRPLADDYPDRGLGQPEADILPEEYDSSLRKHHEGNTRKTVAQSSVSPFVSPEDDYHDGGVGQPEADQLPSEYIKDSREGSFAQPKGDEAAIAAPSPTCCKCMNAEDGTVVYGCSRTGSCRYCKKLTGQRSAIKISAAGVKRCASWSEGKHRACKQAFASQ